MRTMDAIEKVTQLHSEYLAGHLPVFLTLFKKSNYPEIKCHLALIADRLPLDKKDKDDVTRVLMRWLKDQAESKIVRVNALQGLVKLNYFQEIDSKYRDDLFLKLEKEEIPSLNARIRQVKNK